MSNFNAKFPVSFQVVIITGFFLNFIGLSNQKVEGFFTKVLNHFPKVGWPASAPSRRSGIGGVKGHNWNEISFPGSAAVPVPP
jgi:hypothetical protein